MGIVAEYYDELKEDYECARCRRTVTIDTRDLYDWEHRGWVVGTNVYGGRMGVLISEIGGYLCFDCRKEMKIEWVGKYEKMELDKQKPKPAPTPDVKRECATCEGVFDNFTKESPCSTCYGYTNWRPGAKK